ncbi:hypothetical protein CPE1_0900 [Chlamydia pecorum PV3056/3]|uniref:hypothetical protein n=1 Tax=Chlamydia pecorum TaxID=85991 RepID=UPI0003AE7289|nr:hypothetical protein [Chlamydia pecorum]AGW38368.1 hypothetical protein CPE1_0900 [Chlamydia pecorum PV3056/3]
MVDEAPKKDPSNEPSSQISGIKKKVKDLHMNPKVHSMKHFFMRHAREIIGGALLLFGIISDFVSWIGGAFVACGIVLGFYKDIRLALANMQYYYNKNGPIKNALLCGLLLFFMMNMFTFVVAFLLLCVILIFIMDARPPVESQEHHHLSDHHQQ